jgi:hypothetical protein
MLASDAAPEDVGTIWRTLLRGVRVGAGFTYRVASAAGRE